MDTVEEQKAITPSKNYPNNWMRKFWTLFRCIPATEQTNELCFLDAPRYHCYFLFRGTKDKCQKQFKWALPKVNCPKKMMQLFEILQQTCDFHISRGIRFSRVNQGVYEIDFLKASVPLFFSLFFGHGNQNNYQDFADPWKISSFQRTAKTDESEREGITEHWFV